MNNNTLLKTLITLGIITFFALIFTQNGNMPGDVNSDGSVDVQDVVLMVDIILNDGAGYSDDQLWASDVNEDSVTDISDIVIIVDRILNPPDLIECDPGYYLSPDSTTCLLDTTSHYFTWTIDTLGIYGSYLNDVAIVNENDIWVVGNIETDSGSYNAAHWNGDEWELIEIQPQGYVIPIQCIYYFNENDIWFGQGGLPIQWNGNEYYLYTPANGEHPGQPSIDSIWGTSSSDLYFVGRSGSIVHYDGSSFVQMDSGTDVDLKDVAGTPDGEYVFVIGYSDSGESVVLQLNNSNWQTMYFDQGYWPENDSTGAVLGTYVFQDTVYFSRRGGLWKYNFLTEGSTIIPAHQNSFDEHGYAQIIVSDLNDIFIKDWGFSLLHYNGDTWQSDVSLNDYFGWYGIESYRFDIRDDLILIVGCVECWFGRAVVIKGYR